MKWFKKLLNVIKAQKDRPPSNFTPRAQQVLTLARQEADRLRHNYIGTEHILLGLIMLGQGVAINVLQGLGTSLENVRKEVERLAPAGPQENSAGAAPYTPRVKKVLDYARREAKNLHHTYIGTEHLLLGLLREGEGLAAQILKNFNADFEQVRAAIFKELDPALVPNDLLGPPAKPNKPFVNIRDWSAKIYGGDFTPRAIETLAHARQEAERLHHNFVGGEHILLGLIKLDIGTAAILLKDLGLDLEKTRAEVKKLARIRPDEKMPEQIPYTPRAKRILHVAKKEAEALHHTFVGTEHILLGLLGESDGLAAEVFKNFKVDMEQLRKKIYDELKPPGDGPQKKE